MFTVQYVQGAETAKERVPNSSWLEGVQKFSQRRDIQLGLTDAQKFVRWTGVGKGILSMHRAQGCETMCAWGWESSVRWESYLYDPIRGDLPLTSTFSSVSYTPTPLVPLLILQKTLFLHHSSLRRSHGSTLILFQS